MADMTWGDFKRKAEAKGVRDEDVLAYVDWSGCCGDPDDPDDIAHVGVGRYPDPKLRGIIWIGDQ